MEEWKLQLEAMQQRWEDGHTHLVRPEAAGEITHGGVQREARFILLTPTSRRQSAAQILTHTNI